MKRSDHIALVSQVDHARLCGRLAEGWGSDRFAQFKPLSSMVKAADLHDEGWASRDERPLYNPETKGPLDFLEIDLAEHTRFYGKAVDQAAQQHDIYAALLISMHWTGLYVSRWGWQGTVNFDLEDSGKRHLYDVVESQQKHWVQMKSQVWTGDTRRSEFEHRLWMNYEFLQVLDLLSLFACRTDLKQQADQTVEHVRTGHGDEETSLRLSSVGDGVSISVGPYPFAERIQSSIPIRRIEDRPYSDESDLREAWLAASVEELAVAFVPSG